MRTIIITISALLLSTAQAQTQAWVPPDCTGANRALQYGNGSWICATMSGATGPAGPQGAQGPPGPQGPTGPQGPAGTGGSVPAQPPATECITSNWDGTKWTCVPTQFLTAQ
jgi:hypothetical protein